MSPRARRRGGRGRRRPPSSTPAPKRSLWQRLLGFLGVRPKPSSASPKRRSDSAEAQEARVFREFSKQYGIPFQDISLLKLALTHRSYLSVTGQSARESNERLEFLGDSVLGLVTSEFLYRRHPDEHEGQLTKVKSLLVSKAILSRRALRMGLGRYVLMSHSEVESGGRQRLSIIADAFESVLGAIYLDQGFETARKFIHDHLLVDADDIVADKRHTNYKSHLQEYVQSTYRTHPVYRIRSEYGPDHSKHFMVEVMVGRRQLGEGRGHNKKEAEQAAARDAIERVTELRREASEGRRSPREERRGERASEEAASPVARSAGDEADRDDEPEERGARRRGRRRGGRGRTHEERGAARAERPEAPGTPEAEDRELAEEAEERGEPLFERVDEEGLEDEDLHLEDPDDEDDALDEEPAEEPYVDPFVDEEDLDTDSSEAPGGRGRPSSRDAESPAAPPPAVSRATLVFGRGRRAGRAPSAAPEPAPAEAAVEEQRHVDPFALEPEQPLVVASDLREEPGAEPEPDKEALIEEMERAMENFGRRTRPARRRRGH